MDDSKTIDELIRRVLELQERHAAAYIQAHKQEIIEGVIHEYVDEYLGMSRLAPVDDD